MGSLHWSDRSVKDINSIFSYISRDSVFYAERFIRSLILHADKLKDLPQIGRIVPEFENVNIREIIFKNYRIIYRTNTPNEVEILSILHSARELRELK